ncbi:MAG: GNAT family N-acetyltransferase [Propionibacteriaceae bacterium]|jgi:GNAT superfamily N-acetyltransferase|nr:GNAT family N-acetyltransferase [Propionibacteriaceae bacterium]
MPDGDHGAVVESTLEWSVVTEADLLELYELRSAMEYFDNPIYRASLDDISTDFRRGSVLPGWAATMGRVKGGGVVAYCGIHPDDTGRLWVQIAVHPTARHRQLGRKMVQWAIRRSLEWQATRGADTKLWLGYLLEERRTGLIHVLIEEGFQAERWFFDAHRDLLEEPAAPQVDPAVRLVPYTPVRAAEVRPVLNQVREHLAGSYPVSDAAWQQHLQLVDDCEGLSWLAEETDTDAVVGYALNTALSGGVGEPDEGWTLHLGVAPSSRHHGIGTALLQAAMHAFWHSGLSRAGIGVDTDDPELALEFFRRCGYTLDDRLVQLRYRPMSI